MKELIIKEIPFTSSQYYPEIQTKNQIVLHHTVSDPTSPLGDVNSWLSDNQRVATYAILGYDGTLYKCFKSNHWGHHLGIKQIDLKRLGFKDYLFRNELLNKHSIAIEIDAWGGLTKQGNKFLNAYGKPISDKLEVADCNWRGYTHFQKYSDAQIEALEFLLPIIMEANKIPNHGLKDGNFGVSMDALSGVPGIYSHSNYRADKSDLYPDERIIKLLNSLP